MTFTKVVTLWCDEEDCTEHYEYDRASAMEARENAEGIGWEYEDGEDYCPDHADERSADTGGESA